MTCKFISTYEQVKQHAWHVMDARKGIQCVSLNITYIEEISCPMLKTLVLKLDFKRAFDTVSWDRLLETLRIRGFDNKWLG
jgi:hypothetical protein